MSQPVYPLFSKKHQKSQRSRRGIYNFEKTKEYQLAEKWFEERREAKQCIISVLEKPDKKVIVTKPYPNKLPPGLEVFIKKHIDDDCGLDLVIPSYNDFNYTDSNDNVLLSFPIESNIFEIQYSTPLFVEE